MRKIKMSMALMCCVALASCAPQLNFAGQAGDQTSATKVVSGEVKYTTFAFQAGSVPAKNLLMYIGGKNLSYNDARCKPVGNGLGCELGDVAAGERKSVNVDGEDLSASVKYDRGSGFVFNYRFF